MGKEIELISRPEKCKQKPAMKNLLREYQSLNLQGIIKMKGLLKDDFKELNEFNVLWYNAKNTAHKNW